MCFFFTFLGLNLFFKYVLNGQTRMLIFGLVSYFLSLLSKETSITFVLIIPLIFFFSKYENKKRNIHVVIYSWMIAGLFLLVRFSVLYSYKAFNPAQVTFYQNALVGAPSIASRFATAIFILGYYIKMLIIPYPLICDYSFNAIPYVEFNNFGVLTTIVFYLLLIYFGLVNLIKIKFGLMDKNDAGNRGEALLAYV